MTRMNTDGEIENTGLIRCANAGFVVEKTLASGLADVFHNTSPLGDQAQPRIFSQRFLSEAQAQGHLRSIMSDVLSESRASSLAKGFESTAPAWLAQAQPCASSIIRANPCHLTRSFPLPRPSGQPSVALSRTCPRARLWFQKQ